MTALITPHQAASLLGIGTRDLLDLVDADQLAFTWKSTARGTRRPLLDECQVDRLRRRQASQ